MDVNLELVKRIISSDDLCDKVNSGDNSELYIKQIEQYILSLIDDGISVSNNIDCVNRYLRKFVVYKSKEDIFFNKVLLKIYRLNINDAQFLNILDGFNFDEVKELLIQRYNQYILNRNNVSNDVLIKMLSLFCYTCPNFIFPEDYINYFTFNLYSKNVSLDYDLISYFYRQFALGFAKSKDISTTFLISDDVVSNDPYYDNKRNKIVLYKQNINDTIDPIILSDIFYQITYLYILKGINDPNNKRYTYEQLELVKEICLISILGENYYDVNYGNVSFSFYLKKQSDTTTFNYFRKLGLNVIIDRKSDESLVIDINVDDKTDKAFSVDILFDQILKRENPNLLSGLVKNYPILGCEYKDKKKSLLSLVLDIYNNKKLLGNLNKDLSWHKSKYDSVNYDVTDKIDKLNSKISVCSSYINVMNSIVLNGDMTSYDLFRSISDLITYDHSNQMVKNDIYLILRDVVPKKLKRLCSGRSEGYKEFLKNRLIKCYLDSMSLVKNHFDVPYFMKIYSTLEFCIAVFDID